MIRILSIIIAVTSPWFAALLWMWDEEFKREYDELFSEFEEWINEKTKHIPALFAFLLLSLPASAAFTEFYVQTTASNLNAGSTSDNAAAHTYASGTWVASTGVFTVASGNPSSDAVVAGDFASVYADGSSATGFVGRVTAVSSTTITVSLSAIHGTAPADGTSNRTLKIGGAWDGPSGSVGFPFGFVKSTGMNASSDPVRVNFKTGVTYAVTAAMTHANNGSIFWEAYQTTLGDHGAQAIIDGGATGVSFTVLTVSAGDNSFDGFTFQNNGNSDGAAATRLVLLSGAGGNIFKRCSFKNSWQYGIDNNSLNAEVIYYECEATGCRVENTDGDSVGGIRMNLSGSLALRCFAYSNVLDGFSTDGGVLLMKSIAANNGASGCGGTGDENLFMVSNDFYGNADDGVSLGDGNLDPMNQMWINNNFVDNGLYGKRNGGQPTPGVFLKSGYGTGTAANTSGLIETDKWWTSFSSVAYTANATPYNAPGSMDFRITLDGAEGTGYGLFTQEHPSYSDTVGYPSIGAAQQ